MGVAAGPGALGIAYVGMGEDCKTPSFASPSASAHFRTPKTDEVVGYEPSTTLGLTPTDITVCLGVCA